MSTRIQKLALISVLFTSIALPLGAQAGDCLSCGPSNGSEMLSGGAGIVLLGSMSMVAASGQVIVDTVKTAADGVTVVVKGSTQAVSATIKLSGKGIEKAALVSGAVIEVSATSTGYLLVSAGKALAFIPNEVGSALMQHNKVQ
ncbi:hypothetical protein [Undibacterium sp. TJN19]|uniref:hypothetical protein n=1 Tax=Undibacterium sp. TJN19 TaxID=3413055 RepID=UPI003BF2371F